MNRLTIGQRLVELRGDRTQREVAHDIGISLASLKSYECGERIPRDEIKVKFAIYFGLFVEQIFQC